MHTVSKTLTSSTPDVPLQCNINAEVLLAQADGMVAGGLVAAGYKTLNIDDCWPLRERSATGEMCVAKSTFPPTEPVHADPTIVVCPIQQNSLTG